MDLRRLRIGEWLMGAAGVALLAVLFVDWYGVDGDVGAYGSPGEPITFDGGLNAWQAFTVHDVVLALLAVAAVATIPLVAGSRSPSPGIAYETLVLLGGIIGVVICLVRLIDVPADGLSLRPGAWIGLAVALGLCASCLVAMRDERLSTPDQLTDASGIPVDVAAVPEDLPAPPP